MAENLKVEWSVEARSELRRSYRFAEDQWSEIVADQFLDLVMEFERRIAQFPYGSVSLKGDPYERIGQIHKHVRAIYRITGRSILIVSIVDNRSSRSQAF